MKTPFARTSPNFTDTNQSSDHSGPNLQTSIKPNQENDNDLPLRKNIRLLGRILGDTVREDQGEKIFNIIEQIRKFSVAFRRSADPQAKMDLQKVLKDLTLDETLIVVRAFSYFSHLANIAEDLHHGRCLRDQAVAGSAPQPGSISKTLDFLDHEKISGQDILAFFDHAKIVPVLTAHPTEVQRKTILELEMNISSLLQESELRPQTPEEQIYNEESLRREILLLWQTRMLRFTKLAVIDEVKNGLSYFDKSFLEEVPQLYHRLEDSLASRYPEQQTDLHPKSLPPFLHIGSWIGGDRDGNPFVTAQVMEKTLSLQSSRIFEFYLRQLHKLGAELSPTQMLVQVSEELKLLAEKSPDESPHRNDEPYRRAIVGMYSRMAMTAHKLDQQPKQGSEKGKAEPYKNHLEFLSDLTILQTSLDASAEA